MARESVYWIDAGGYSLALNDLANTFCTRERGGMWNAPWQLSSEELSGLPGSVHLGARMAERVVTMGVEVRADSNPGLAALLREIAYRTAATRGAGILRVVSDGPMTRELHCRPAGIQGVRERDRTASLVLEFRANDPLWYEGTQQSYTFSAGATVPFFPIFPIRLMISSEYSEASISNDGDVESWPVWSVSGPADDLVIENNTSGKKIDLTGLGVDDGEQLVIDTRPEAKSVLLDGTDVIANLTLASELFELEAGANSITVRLNNQGANTEVTAAYYRRYITA